MGRPSSKGRPASRARAYSIQTGASPFRKTPCAHARSAVAWAKSSRIASAAAKTTAPRTTCGRRHGGGDGGRGGDAEVEPWREARRRRAATAGSAEDPADHPAHTLRVGDAVDGRDLEPPLAHADAGDRIPAQPAGQGGIHAQDVAGPERGPAVLHRHVELQAVAVVPRARG